MAAGLGNADDTSQPVDDKTKLVSAAGTLSNRFVKQDGISANEALGFLMVTSETHPDQVASTGNTVTLIDLDPHEMLKTCRVADSPTDLSDVVEVLLLRNEFPPYALATTVAGG